MLTDANFPFILTKALLGLSYPVSEHQSPGTGPVLKQQLAFAASFGPLKQSTGDKKSRG